MTDEIRKQIDGLPIFSTNEVVDCTIQANWVLMSDVIELVEKLTKWNKVDDCLPEVDTIVLWKTISGNYIVDEIDHDMDFRMLNSAYCNDLIEWKPII